MLSDFGAIMRSGAALVPDFAAISAQRQQLGIQNMQAQTQANQEARMLAGQEREVARQSGFEEAFTTWLDNDGSLKGIQRLRAAYPEFHQQVQKTIETQDEATRTNNRTQLGNIFGALANGRKDLARDAIAKRREADLKAGQDTSDEDALLEMIDSQDPQDHRRARSMIGYELANTLGEAHFSSGLDRLLDTTKLPDAEEYAQGLGLEPGTEDYRTAMRDYVLRGSGPTAHAYDVELEGARQGNRRQLVVDRAANRPAKAPPAPRQTNVLERIRQKIAAGQGLSSGEQRLWDESKPGRRGGGGRPSRTDAAVAVNPKTGEKLILRDGRWVPLK